MYLALYLALKRTEKIARISLVGRKKNHTYTTIARHHKSEHDQTVACKQEKANYVVYKTEAMYMIFDHFNCIFL